MPIPMNNVNIPWYKQFWVWFLILLPCSVVVASLFTFYLFSQQKMDLVAEDHYKKGKAINQELSLLRQAHALSVYAELTIEDQLAIFTLHKGNLDHYPTLNVNFQHRTLAENDIISTLQPDKNGRYFLPLDENLSGPWFIEINDDALTWSLNSRNTFPLNAPVLLVGKK